MDGNRAVQLSPGDTRLSWLEALFLQPLPRAAQPAQSLSRVVQRHPKRAQPNPLPVLCLAGEAPEPLGLCGAVLLPGTRLLQGASAAAEAQLCPDAAVPVLQLSAEAQAEETSKMGHLEEEETALLPSALKCPAPARRAAGRAVQGDV